MLFSSLLTKHCFIFYELSVCHICRRVHLQVKSTSKVSAQGHSDSSLITVHYDIVSCINFS